MLAELVVCKKEESIILTLSENIHFYKKYVDDILVVKEKTSDRYNLKNLLSDESLGLSLKRQERDELTINYLDVSIKIANGDYITSVFRKNTYKPFFIKSTAKEPWNYKMAAFKMLLQRILTDCSNQDVANKELEWVLHKKELHGYSRNIILKLWEKITHKNTRQDANDNNNTYDAETKILCRK